MLIEISGQAGHSGGGALRRIWGYVWGFADSVGGWALVFCTHRWATLRFFIHSLSSWETSSAEEFSLPSDQRSFGPSDVL